MSDKFIEGPECVRCGRREPWHPDGSCHVFVAAVQKQLPVLRSEFMARVFSELDRAYAKHGRGQWGRHEFYGILKEEVDELWADIKGDAPQAQLEKELVQVAAMCFRYFETRDRYREPAVVANE